MYVWIQCSTIVSMDVALLVQHFHPCVGTDTVFYNSEYGRGTISTYFLPCVGTDTVFCNSEYGHDTISTTLSPLCRYGYSVLQS